MRKFSGNLEYVVRGDQTTGDIISAVVNAHAEGLQDYENFALQFDSRDPVTSAQKVFNFCKRQIKYKIETGNFQSTRSLAAILAMGSGDCKHYSQLIAGVLAVLKEKNRWPITLAFRFASYEFFDSTPKHVFVVMKYKGSEYWVDPVLKFFNQRSPAPVFFTDRKITSMPLVHISGVPGESFQVVREVVAHRSNVGAVILSDEYKATEQTTVPTVQNLTPGSPSNAFDPLTSPLNVQYLVGNEPLKFPMQNQDGNFPPLCPQDMSVIYPTTWGGEAVPPNLPRPFSVGNRIVLLPKNIHQDVYKLNNWKWLIFMVRVMQPLVNSYSIYPSKNWQLLPGKTGLANTLLADAIFWDSDLSDIIDYVGLMPTLIPISRQQIPEIQYLVATDKLQADGKTPIFEPLIFPDRLPGEPPATLPKRIWVEYPTTFKGVPVPANLPRPYINQDNGLLQLWPKGITDVEMKANYFFWLSFVTSAMAPFIRAYAPVDYTLKGNVLSDQILYDCDNRDIIQNYLAMPKPDSILEAAVQVYKNVITSIGRGFLSISMLLPRQAFMLLCRFNFLGWGRKFHQGFKYDLEFFNKTKKRWEDLGGNFTNLVDACENGREKIDLTPEDSEYILQDANAAAAVSGAGIGEPISVGAALVLGASCIAAMAPIIKLFTDAKTDAVLDAAAGAANVVLTATGNDPIKLGQQTGAPTVITDPVTGEQIVIPAPTNDSNFDTWVRMWVPGGWLGLIAGGLALSYGIYKFSSRKKLSL